MKNFKYVNAASTEEAIQLLSSDSSSGIIAGGTDILARMKLGITAPDRLVNLKTIPGLDVIRFSKADGLRIGALVTLDTIARSSIVHEVYPAFFRAIELSASPQLRNQGTIGGNLAQFSRCWYYRGPFNCWLKGGEICYAKDGENGYHAIFGEGPCYTVHPSDPAPALIALRAEVTIAGPEGEHMLPLEKFFQQPGEKSRRLTVLEHDEVIVEVKVPPLPGGSRGTYTKAMERKTWAFALASVAVQLNLEGDRIRDARLVLGGVAATPWRAVEAEASLQGRRFDEGAIRKTAELIVSGARSLVHNRYKIALVKGLVTEALSTLKEAP